MSYYYNNPEAQKISKSVIDDIKQVLSKHNARFIFTTQGIELELDRFGYIGYLDGSSTNIELVDEVEGVLYSVDLSDD